MWTSIRSRLLRLMCMIPIPSRQSPNSPFRLTRKAPSSEVLHRLDHTKRRFQTVPLICKINDAETTNILRQIQNVWNALYTDYTNRVDIESVKKYFTDDFDNSVITDICSIIPGSGKTRRERGSGIVLEFYMKEAIPWTTNNYGCAILNTPTLSS